ncbi:MULTISPECIES: glycoside hydrolase family 48 protein [unclassified Streptomyces]|uniref:glycoside hydrolase family 48 protein n=1 Tax=unclassified Streptomyces TaxID=2593676 RepID=UPI002B1CC0FF|nr:MULTISPECIES: glycoside hydrolase family 48 protein [unclassified Streptomyces]
MQHGYGHTPGKREAGPAETAPSYVDTFRRGPRESVRATVTHPTCGTFTYYGRDRVHV